MACHWQRQLKWEWTLASSSDRAIVLGGDGPRRVEGMGLKLCFSFLLRRHITIT